MRTKRKKRPGEIIVASLQRTSSCFVGKYKGGHSVYIGRKSRERAESALHNPFWLKIHTRESSLANYERYFNKRVKRKTDPDFMAELARLLALARDDRLILVCYCAPLPCHGGIIKRWLERKLGR